MWGPGYSSVFLFLLLELTPQPGVSQGAHLFKYCNECKNNILEDVSEIFYQILVKKANYTVCPHNIIRFQLPRGKYCGSKTESWVGKVTKCIDEGRTHCLPPSENKQDFSKGSDEKPPTTTKESTTSTAKTTPTLRLSTQTWKGGTLKPLETTTEEPGTTEKILHTTRDLSTTEPDSDQINNQLHGNKPPAENNDENSKMKHMTIAVISLIFIVLVMTAVGVYVWCRKARVTGCNRHRAPETVRYQPTPAEESEL